MTRDILIKNTCEATQLRKYINDQIDGDPLWISRYNATNPDAVAQIYLDYLEAGADIFAANTYQSSIEGYMEHLGISKGESIELIKKTVKLAHDVREKYLAKCGKERCNDRNLPWVAASVGPYGAHLHDGSEYTGAYANKISADTLKKFHKSLIDPILEVGVDALAIETIPCLAEAKVLADLLCDDYPNIKFWISLQCKDKLHLASGDSFAETCSLLWKQFNDRNIAQNCLGLGLNCLNPKLVTPLLGSVNGNKPEDERIPLIVYPNSGEAYDGADGWQQVEKPPSLHEFVPKWIELGVKIIGGCCRTKIEDISLYREIIEKIK